MADKLLQPLAQNFKIVDPNGFPTLYFIKWAQQRQIDIQDSITLDTLLQYFDDHRLQQGSGISITPDGNLSHSPLITANAQQILDQITNVRGSVLYRGAGGWAGLAPGTAGQFLKTNGAGADPAWAAASGGGGALTPPVAATFPTRINNGTETQVVDGIDGLVMAVDGPPASATNRLMLKALGAAPRTYVAKIATMAEGTANNRIGFVIRDSASGKFIRFGVAPTNPTAIIVDKWTSPTVFSATAKTANATIPENAWFRIVDTGLDFIFQLGLSGVGWITFYSESRTAFLAAPDQIGFGIEDGTQPSAWLTVQSYAEAAIPVDPGPYRYARVRHTAAPGAFIAWTAVEFMATVGGANLATVPAQGFADSFFAGLPPGNAYDGLNTTWWANNGTGVGSYIAYDFLGSPTPILQAALTTRNDGSWGQNATAIAVEGTNDGLVWYTKFTAAGIVWTGPNQRQLFS